MLTSGVIITLIICGTLIIMSIVSAIGKAHERKQVNKHISEFTKAFPKFDEKNQDNDSNDYFKKF